MEDQSLSIRDFEERDISALDNYWQTLTPDDLQRMSIDPAKLPSSSEFKERLGKVLHTPTHQRPVDPLIWEVGGKAVGFTNLNNIDRPQQGEIHLHIFDKNFRGKGYGRRLFMMSVHQYFLKHGLAKIICQPSSTNPGPNGLMTALGVAPSKTFRTVPSFICIEHEVNLYEFMKPILGTL